MVRLFAMYPNKPDSKFDFDYYASVHMQMAKERLGEFGLREVGITKGTTTLDGEPAPYIYIGTADFDNAEDMQRGFEAHAEAVMADIPNYTDIQPEIQISEVLSAD